MLKTKGEETEGLIIFVVFCIFCYFCSFSCFNRRWLGVGRVGQNESGSPVFLVLFEVYLFELYPKEGIFFETAILQRV